LKSCAANGIAEQQIASRDKAAYKKAKKWEWGDTL
jgi:ribosomal protein RSM22 (predicted rRNA methylase)